MEEMRNILIDLVACEAEIGKEWIFACRNGPAIRRGNSSEVAMIYSDGFAQRSPERGIVQEIQYGSYRRANPLRGIRRQYCSRMRQRFINL